MNNTEEHIDELLGKYLIGEATVEEQQEVELWLQQGQNNVEHFNQVKTLLETTSAISHWQKFDTDAAWNTMREKMYHKKIVPLHQPKTTLWYWFAAASVVIVLSLLYINYRWINKPVVEYVAESYDQTVQDTLPDGTTSFLNRESTLRFTYNPSDKKRIVKLEGEAFFQIEESEVPFVVHVDQLIIEDIGTSFNVKGYDDAATVEMYVESGEIYCFTTNNHGIKLKAGESGVYHRHTDKFEKTTTTENTLSYKTMNFHFANRSLKEIAHDLNAVYSKKLILANEAIGECNITVSFQNESLDVISEIIAETLNLTRKDLGNQIVLDGKGCE